MNRLVSIAVYDPRRLDRDAFLAGFVARREFVEFLLDKLRQMPDVAEHHIIVGQRGMGKTSLLLRLAIAIASEPVLRERYIPLTFREEQYNVRSLDTFWRNCAEALAEWCEAEGKNEIAADIDRSLLTPPWRDSRSAVEAFLETARKLGGRPVLFVDNLDLILDALTPEQNWELRRTLQATGGPILFGAATQMLSQSADRDAAFYEFFHPHVLDPLSETELLQCMSRLAEARGEAGKPVREVLAAEPERLRTLHTLTGGNPRVLTLVYQLLERTESDTVFSDLEVLLDQLTPFYKARVEEYQTELQRAIIDAIALNWHPITSHDLSKVTAVEVTTVSPQLNRLKSDGLIEEVQTSGARSGYQLVERFFNIWYLMRHGTRRTRQKIYWLTAFLTSFYAPAELMRMRAESAIEGHSNLHPFYKEALEAVGEIWSLKTGEKAPVVKAGPQPSTVASKKRTSQQEKHVRSLIQDARRLGEQGRSEEAVKVYDEVISRFGLVKDLAIREQVARALINKGFRLGLLGRNEEAISAYDEVVALFGSALEPILREGVARALLNKGIKLHSLGRFDDAIAIYDEILRRFGEAEEIEFQERVAEALNSKGNTLGQLGRSEEAIATYDELVNRFENVEELAIRKELVRALVNQALRLNSLGRSEEAIAVSNDAIYRIGGIGDSTLREGIIRSLINKAIANGRLGRNDEAIDLYDEVIKQFGEEKESQIGELVAGALVNKGNRLGMVGRPEEAIAVYDDAVNKFGAVEKVEVVAIVAGALINKGHRLGALDRNEEAIAAYNEVLRRLETAEQPILRERRARALVNKSLRLAALQRNEEAILISEEVVRQFGAAEESALREVVALALHNKAERLRAVGRREEAIAAYDEVVHRYSGAVEVVVQGRAAAALLNKGVLLGDIGKVEEEVATYDQLMKQFSTVEEPLFQQIAASALLNKANRLDLLGRPEDAEATYDEIISRYAKIANSNLHDTVLQAFRSESASLISMGRIEAAEAVSRRAVEFGPKDYGAWITLGNTLSDHSSKLEEAESAYRSAISLSESRLVAQANLAWLYFACGRTAEAAALRTSLDELHPVGVALLNAAAEVSADNFGATTSHLSNALAGDQEQLNSVFADDVLRLLRMAEAHGFGEKLIAWFVESGEAEQRAPVYAAFVAYVRGDRFLLDFSPEVRKPAERILRWLSSRRKVEHAETPTPQPKRRRGRPPHKRKA